MDNTVPPKIESKPGVTRNMEVNTTNKEAIKFTLFSNLPKELQLDIWGSALQDLGGRIIKFTAEKFFDVKDGVQTQVIRCVSKCKTPAMMHACADSRKVALKVYQLILKTDLRHPIYFDPRRDVLFSSTTDDMIVFLCTTNMPLSMPPGISFSLVVNENSRSEYMYPDFLEHMGVIVDQMVTCCSKLGAFREVIVLRREDARPRSSRRQSTTEPPERRYINWLDYTQTKCRRRREEGEVVPEWKSPTVTSMTTAEWMTKMGFQS